MVDSEAPQTAEEALQFPGKWRQLGNRLNKMSFDNKCLGKDDGVLCEVTTVNGVEYRIFCLSQKCADVFEKIA